MSVGGGGGGWGYFKESPVLNMMKSNTDTHEEGLTKRNVLLDEDFTANF